jgi:very-short-patch-repair endonuclease
VCSPAKNIEPPISEDCLRGFCHTLTRVSFLRALIKGGGRRPGGWLEAMTLAFNRKKDQKKRRYFRKNMPKSEVILWSKLKNKQMLGERFLRQYGVDQFVLDFYCPRLKLAIEVDGDSHFMIGKEEQDKNRQKYIEKYGIKFLRFTNEDIKNNINGVCDQIYSIIDERANNEK